ncbi:PLP-dependent cysteine synthase family protein [Vulcaniibacterium gelatinicum]|uniref:PLP-dependent cysteine synthase family protein n=1 Tax=Vulcaniibacterium gelatinicum TaxID=2598725 RepID=UPI0011CBD6A8|nr:pyridoxal-phosphate dependent enzyme [Vulcaniibacterium gelatinicum]
MPLAFVPPARVPPRADRAWIAATIARLAEEARTHPDTPMRELRLPGFPHVRFLLKDESVHPTGSLKHRLARSLFLYALCSGRLRCGQPAVDASSGSTAISEAWFARALGVPFIAVMPRTTAIAKQREVAALGGRCELVEPGEDPAARARALAAELDACYLDQFGLAGSATDWRGNNNIAQSILEQCTQLGVDDPSWIVCGAGTGGTSATIGRYLRYRGSAARLCVAEPRGGAFAEGWRSGDRCARASRATCIEGIGRPCVEPCFAFELADEVLEVDDAASIAALRLLHRWTGGLYGGSSGTNLVAALALAARMRARDERGSIVLLLCDRGERYADTLFSTEWLAEHGYALEPWLQALERAAAAGTPFDPMPATVAAAHGSGLPMA